MVENTAVYKFPSMTCGAEFQQQKNFSQDLCCGETPPPEEREQLLTLVYSCDIQHAVGPHCRPSVSLCEQPLHPLNKETMELQQLYKDSRRVLNISLSLTHTHVYLVEPQGIVELEDSSILERSMPHSCTQQNALHG